jgi:hypothetical protein
MVQTGAMHFTLVGDGFLWNGIDNLVLDLSWLRSSTNGSSPAVRLVEDLPYTATKWVQVLTSFHPGHGNTYQDDPLSIHASTGTTFNRPVTTFNSSLVEMPMAAPEEHVNGTTMTWFDPATGSAVITRPVVDQGAWSVVCTDITGRTIAQGAFPSGSETIRIPFKADYQGVVVLFAVRADGSRLDLGRLISIR